MSRQTTQTLHYQIVSETLAERLGSQGLFEKIVDGRKDSQITDQIRHWLAIHYKGMYEFCITYNFIYLHLISLDTGLLPVSSLKNHMKKYN